MDRIAVVIPVALLAAAAGCGPSKAQRLELENWLSKWKGPAPRVAVEARSEVPDWPADADACHGVTSSYRMYVDPSAPVRATLVQRKSATNNFEIRVQVTTARGGLVYDQPWRGSYITGAACNEAVAQAFRVFGVENSGAPAAAAPSGSPGRPPVAEAVQAPPLTFVAASPQPNSYALIIGIEHYRDVPAATDAKADATNVARLVRESFGVPEGNIRLALEDHATKVDIEKQLDWLKDNVPAGGRVYFYFSGHGAPEPSLGTSYVLPYDGDPAALKQTAIQLGAILKRLGETKARDVLAVVDSCFSGAGGRSVLPHGARPLVRVKAPVPPSSRVALFSASSGSEISGPMLGGGGGMFTRYLVEGLGSGKADIDGDGQISLQELFEWVNPRVARDASRDNRQQHPSVSLSDEQKRKFVVTYGVAAH